MSQIAVCKETVSGYLSVCTCYLIKISENILHALITQKHKLFEASFTALNRNLESNKGLLKKTAVVHFYIALISLILISQSKATFLSKEIRD